MYYDSRTNCCLGHGQVPGDYLVTDLPSVGLAIATADCVPIVLYHPGQPLIGAIHMGWRGAVTGTIANCLDHISRQYGVDPGELRALVGPCARSCCYEIQPDLVDRLTNSTQEAPPIFSIVREKYISI